MWIVSTSPRLTLPTRETVRGRSLDASVDVPVSSGTIHNSARDLSAGAGEGTPRQGGGSARSCHIPLRGHRRSYHQGERLGLRVLHMPTGLLSVGDVLRHVTLQAANVAKRVQLLLPVDVFSVMVTSKLRTSLMGLFSWRFGGFLRDMVSKDSCLHPVVRNISLCTCSSFGCWPIYRVKQNTEVMGPPHDASGSFSIG